MLIPLCHRFHRKHFASPQMMRKSPRSKDRKSSQRTSESLKANFLRFPSPRDAIGHDLCNMRRSVAVFVVVVLEHFVESEFNKH